jgi:hypothetical protein
VNDTISKAIFLMLGWVLGLIGASITDLLRDWRRLRLIKRAVRTELQELRVRLAGVVFQVAAHFGRVDRDLLKWLTAAMEGYSGALMEGLVDFRPLLAATDEQLREISGKLRAAAGVSLIFRRYQLSFLDKHIDQLSHLDVAAQAKLLDIRTQLALLTEMVDEAQYFYRLTFQSNLTDTAKGALDKNIDQSHELVGQRSKFLVERIGAYLTADDA